jgi:hypothetical protein
MKKNAETYKVACHVCVQEIKEHYLAQYFRIWSHDSHVWWCEECNEKEREHIPPVIINLGCGKTRIPGSIE